MVKGADVHHLRSVLRKEIGDKILVGLPDRTYTGLITAIDSEEITIKLLEPLAYQTESPLITVLYQGIAKGDRMDYAIRKAVELGVTKIVPFFSDHTVVKLEGAARQEQKRLRWQKIATAAAKQSKRDVIPEVALPLEFSNLISTLEERDPNHLVIMADEAEKDQGMRALATMQPDTVSILIGPEGGFSDAEVETVKRINGKVVKLGNRIMRTETAGIVVLTLAQYLWGDFR